MSKEKKTGKVTVFDIAEALKISASTVSRSLNDHPNISKKTKKRVFTMAKKLGYGMGLKYKEAKSVRKLIALVIPSLESSFYVEYTKYLQFFLDQFDYNLVIFSTNNQQLQEKKIAEQLTQFKLAAVIISLSNNSEDASSFKILDEYNIPWILFDQVDYQTKRTLITIENARIANRATSHLIGNGYTRVAHLAGHPNSSRYSEVVVGYKQALAENGIEFEKDYLIYSDLTKEDVSESMFRLLSLENPPNAILVGSSDATLEVHHFLNTHNIEIPKEIAIVSYGFETALKYSSPSISHVQLPIRQLAQKTSETIVDMLRDKNTIISTHKIEAKFIIRKSSFTLKRSIR